MSKDDLFYWCNEHNPSVNFNQKSELHFKKFNGKN